jgi:folate-binding protein YgfZ
MRNSLEVIGLEDLGAIRVRGPDAVRFLQGQLSNDVTKLTAAEPMLAGFHNPQGRTIALLRLVAWDADDFLAILPRELAAPVAQRLSKFVLRSKVKVTDESAAWRLLGLHGSSPTIGAAAKCFPAGESRWLHISLADASAPPVNAGRESWERLEVASALPQVYASTSEEFVAQMLNLDAVNAISFEKGCYTGQEVIARAHYRGRVKRRMQRFISRDSCALEPGDGGQLPDGRTLKIVRAAKLDDGRCDFLAVTTIAGSEDSLAGSPRPTEAAAGTQEPAAATQEQPVIHADPAPLPYALPV